MEPPVNPQTNDHFSLSDWHQRFQQQAQWTVQLRRHIFDRVKIQRANRVLDVGCGTGALAEELRGITNASAIALDIDFQSLEFFRRHSGTLLTCGNACYLPYPPAVFDITLCHYLLLWLPDPMAAILEMKRVTRPGGYVLILAEPDYAHRIDFPPELEEPGLLQREALISQGAQPDMGSTVAGLLVQAGLNMVETGLSGGRWLPSAEDEGSRQEWAVLMQDLASLAEREKLATWMRIDMAARLIGQRILFVPVFYAIGMVP